jgi:predicted nucleic acid-binding protein
LSTSARSYLFDAGIISLYYRGERSVKQYFDRVFTANAEGFISEVNLAEFYYKSALQKGIDLADVWYKQIRQSAFQIISPDETIPRRAAQWKVKKRQLSLADCFAIATCEENARLLLTTDHELHKIKENKSIYVAPF